MAALTLTPARALRQHRRFDARAIFGIALMASALGGSVLFWSASSDTREILVAARDLPVGARLTPSDLSIARVRVSDAVYAAAVPAAEQSAVVGRELSEPVHAQQILVRAQVAGRPPLAPGQLAVSIPISAESAAGGRVRPGDVVEVLLTTNKNKPEARTTVVLPRVVVYDVGYEQRLATINTNGAANGGTTGSPAGGQGNRGVPTSLTLTLNSQDDAVAIAQARWSGELDVALLPAAPAGTP